MPTTYHEYTAACTKAQYEEYGQLEAHLLMRNIQSLGIESKEGFTDDDGKTYHHMILVASPCPLDAQLFELFPGITTHWTHKEQSIQKNTPRPSVGKTEMKNGKFYAHTKKYSIRA